MNPITQLEPRFKDTSRNSHIKYLKDSIKDLCKENEKDQNNSFNENMIKVMSDELDLLNSEKQEEKKQKDKEKFKQKKKEKKRRMKSVRNKKKIKTRT